MCFDLRRGGETLFVNYREWASALCLGMRYGWEPLGTVIGEAARWAYHRRKGDDPYTAREMVAEAVWGWDHNYTTNEWQAVAEPDARALAAALRRALADLPREGEAPGKSTVLELPMGGMIDFIDEDKAVSPFEIFMGEGGRARLEQIAEFCGRGRLLIT